MNWQLALPEIAMSVCALAILVFGVTRKPDGFVVCTMLTLGAMLLGSVLMIGAGTGFAFNGQFVSDPYSVFAKLLILAGSAMALVLCLDYNARHGIARFEFPVLVLLSAVGMMLMASASSMMSLYLGLELQSLALYVLAGFARDELRSSEAGLKYFVLGGLASGLLLYGISLAYGFSGTMDFVQLRALLTDPAHASSGLVVGVVFILVGLAFKMSAVPFHMWTPDVYEGAPTPVTSLMGTAPKVAAVVLLLRILVGPFGHLLSQWQLLIEIVSIASMVLGALAAIGQSSIKRLLAYSSIGHMGYALVGFAAGSVEGVQGVLVYMSTYVFMSAGTFACVIAMRRRGRALERISDLAGLARTDPMLASMFAVFMFSMAGIPPLSGFLGKLFVFRAAVDAQLWTLAVVGVLTSVVGAYYYIRVVKVMFFDDSVAAFDKRPSGVSLVALAGALATLLFALVTGSLSSAAASAARLLVG